MSQWLDLIRAEASWNCSTLEMKWTTICSARGGQRRLHVWIVCGDQALMLIRSSSVVTVNDVLSWQMSFERCCCCCWLWFADVDICCCRRSDNRPDAAHTQHHDASLQLSHNRVWQSTVNNYIVRGKLPWLERLLQVVSCWEWHPTG